MPGPKCYLCARSVHPAEAFPLRNASPFFGVAPPKLRFTLAREVQAQRDAGIRFHEERAEHALQGSRPSPLIAGYLLVAAGILLLLVFLVRGGH